MSTEENHWKVEAFSHFTEKLELEKKLKALQAMLDAAVDWHLEEAVDHWTRDDILDNICHRANQRLKNAPIS